MTGVSAREVLINELRAFGGELRSSARIHSNPGMKAAYENEAALVESAADALEAPSVVEITDDKMAAQDLYSAATCGLSTLMGLNVAEGGRMQFIRGVLKRHATYGPDAALTAALKATP